MNINTATIPNDEGKRVLLHKNGNTKDIVNEILNIDREDSTNMLEFSKQFPRDKEGLKELFCFVRDRVNYKDDGFFKQDIKTPEALWAAKEGDCKSKTIFINSVLKCLKIPYSIVFTNYDKASGADAKHVYSIAELEGEKIILDTVYKKFNKEKKPYYKKVYQMTKIYKISGCYPGAKRSTKQADKIRKVVRTTIDNTAKRKEELRQKQQNISPSKPIPFNKVTEGEGALLIAKRELEIIGVMKPQLYSTAKKGIDLINKAIKGDYSLTGDIQKELYPLCRKIKAAEILTMPANSFGVLNKRIQRLKDEREGDKDTYVGAFPERLCLDKLWFLEQANGTYRNNDPMSANFGFCSNNPTYDFEQNIVNQVLSNNNGSPIYYKDILYLFYGRNSKYRDSAREGFSNYKQTLINLSSQSNPPITGGATGYSFWFNNQIDYDYTINEIAKNSNVLTNYLNDIYKNNTGGSMGSGLFYTFSSGVLENGNPINPNLFPPQVIAKGLNQNSFLDACSGFSGISPSNIKGLARNGILFDNMADQPEETLSLLLRLHQNGANVGEVVTIIAAIASAIALIIGAVAGAVAASEEANAQAKIIDQSQADTARLSSLGLSQMPAQNDWAPLTANNSAGGSSFIDPGNKNNLLLLAAFLGVGYYSLKDKK